MVLVVAFIVYGMIMGHLGYILGVSSKNSIDNKQN